MSNYSSKAKCVNTEKENTVLSEEKNCTSISTVKKIYTWNAQRTAHSRYPGTADVTTSIIQWENILYGVLASQPVSNTATHERHNNILLQLQYLEVKWSWTDWAVSLPHHECRDEDSSLCLTGREGFDLISGLWQCAVMTGRFSLGLMRKRPQLELLNCLHVIGWVKTELAVVQATFTPALIILILQFRQLITFNRGRESEKQRQCAIKLQKHCWSQIN